MTHHMTLPATLALVLALSATAASANSFAKMTPDEDEMAAAEPICEPPPIPHGVATGLSEEMAYSDWWERIDLERRLEQRRCDCEPVGITWEEVAAKADPWFDMGKVTPDRTIHDLREERKARRAEMEAALQSMKAESRAMCGAEQ